MPRGRHPENVSPYTGLRVSVCKVTYTQEGGKLPTGGGEWSTFRTVRAQRMVRPLTVTITLQQMPAVPKGSGFLHHGLFLLERPLFHFQ